LVFVSPFQKHPPSAILITAYEHSIAIRISEVETMKTAAIYCRVSTEDQARNYSIPSQLEAIREYATKHDFDVVREFVDEGVSGVILDRPALSELREYVRHRTVDTIIAYDPDRLSRKLVHLMILADEFERQGKQLHFVTQSMGQSPEDKMLFGMKGLFAEYERTKLLERTMRGKLRKAKDGKQPCGKPLFGYRLVNGRHEICDEEAKVVGAIFDWLIEDGLTLYACQKRLNKLSIPSPAGKKWWSRAAVYRIVSNEAYAGTWHYNKRCEKDEKDVIRTREEWIQIPIPAIISKDTFEKARRRFEKNRLFAMRNTRKKYLLSGLLACSKCGRSYTGWTCRKIAYYRCRSKRGDVQPEPCPSSCVRADKIEPLVWNTISQLLSQPQLIIEQVKNMSQYRPSAFVEAGLDRVCHALDAKRIEADRILDAYKIGAIDVQTLKQKMDETKEEQVKLENEKVELEKELTKAGAQELNEEKLYQFCQGLPTMLDNLSFEDKRQILREVVDRIVIDGGEVTIHGIIPPPHENPEDASIVLRSS
jgi:site-specific DNA recombinase